MTGAVSGEVRRSNITSYKAFDGRSENVARSEAKTGADGGCNGDGRAEDGYIVTGGDSVGQ